MTNPVDAECPVNHEDEDDKSFDPFFDEQIRQHVFKNAFDKFDSQKEITALVYFSGPEIYFAKFW